MGFRLIPTSMTLNGVIALILRFFTEFDSFLSNYVTVAEVVLYFNLAYSLYSMLCVLSWLIKRI